MECIFSTDGRFDSHVRMIARQQSWHHLRVYRHFYGRFIQRCFRHDIGCLDGHLLAPHDRLELAGGFVIDKQLFGHRALVAQHVDQKAKRSNAAAQLFKTIRVAVSMGVDQEFFDGVTHPQCGQRGLIKPQHREDSAHLRELAGHFVQGNLVLGVAKELIQRLLNLPQRRSKLIDHTAHGLTVTDTTVKVFHPAFQWLRLAFCTHMLKSLGQPHTALGHLGLCWVQIFVSSLQI